ncbi:hypothetical protein TNCV_3526901 [Trichonephila clavipes]|nr:hypothetical protein TNCV_3526901 [Trichonephila clavipes]
MDGRLSPQYGSRHSLNKIHTSPRSSLTVYDRSLGVESPWFKGRSEERIHALSDEDDSNEFMTVYDNKEVDNEEVEDEIQLLKAELIREG